ncbi:MAG: hypothetical protein E6R04_01440 [Spirochaetes bacterium]|nr:MAG: hypothetical protein E6R04_01440 [Spirochaetota bacterium]
MQILRKNSYRKPAEVGQLVRLVGEWENELWSKAHGRSFDPDNPKMSTMDYLSFNVFFFNRTDLFVVLDRYETCGKKMVLLLTPEGKKILVHPSVVDETPILMVE